MTACQWPSTYCQFTIRVGPVDSVINGGWSLLSGVCVGTVRRMPKRASWYGTQDEVSRHWSGHGLTTTIGADGSEGETTRDSDCDGLGIV